MHLHAVVVILRTHVLAVHTPTVRPNTPNWDFNYTPSFGCYNC